MSLADLSREALAARLVSLYDRSAAINDRLRRHVDHVSYDGGMNDVELLQDELDETMAMILEHRLGPQPPTEETEHEDS